MAPSQAGGASVILKIEQATGRLATQSSGNRALGNNVVTQNYYGLTKMESSRAQQLVKWGGLLNI